MAPGAVRAARASLARDPQAIAVGRRKKSLFVVDNLDKASLRGRLRRVVEHDFFEGLMAAVITTNAVVIGVEAQYAYHDVSALGAPRVDPVFERIDLAFLVFYVLELSGRIIASYWKPVPFPCQPERWVYVLEAFLDRWVMFDAFIVVVGVVMKIIKYSGAEASDISPSAFRLLRLLRLMRAVRLVDHFETLFMLVQGLMNSLPVMLWTILLLLFAVYIFAIIGAEIISRPVYSGDEEFSTEYVDAVRLNFSSLSMTMITLMQFMSFDSIADIYVPLVKDGRWANLLFVLALIAVLGIVLMNLVTAVIVEKAVDQGAVMKEIKVAAEAKRRQEVARDLALLFEDMDDNGDGLLTLAEILEAPRVVRQKLGEVFGLPDCDGASKFIFEENVTRLFNDLDTDGSGAVRRDDFVQALMRVTEGSALQDKLLLVRLEKLCLNIATATGVGIPRKLDDLAERRAISDDLQALLGALDDNGDGMLSVEELRVLLELQHVPARRASKTANMSDGEVKKGDTMEIVLRLKQLVKPRRLQDIDLEHLFMELDTHQTGYIAISDFVFAFAHMAEFSAVRDRHLFLRIEQLAKIAAEGVRPVPKRQTHKARAECANGRTFNIVDDDEPPGRKPHGGSALAPAAGVEARVEALFCEHCAEQLPREPARAVPAVLVEQEHFV